MNNISEILASRKKVETTTETNDKFYQIINLEHEEKFLELQFKNGLRTCFAFEQLGWFNYDAESGYLDLDFNGIGVVIKGRGLYPDLFKAIKSKRVGWIKEADSEMQDHDKNPAYIESISINLPDDVNAGEPEE